MFIKKKLLTFRIYFCFAMGCQAKPGRLCCSWELEKDLLKGSGIFWSVCIYCRKLGPFLHEHGEQSKDQGCLPFCSPRPLYSASQPKSMFFLRATCQYCSGCVKPFFLLHLHAASSSPSNVTAINPHGFPYKITWQKLFSPDHPYYWVAFYSFCLCSKENKKASTEKGRMA